MKVPGGKISKIVVTVGLAAVMLGSSPSAADESAVSRTEMLEDLDALFDFVVSTHPDLSRSADLEQVEAAAKEIRRSLPDSSTVREAWMEMARLNPLFGDAHTGLLRPKAALAAYRDDGGLLCPAPFVIDRAGTLRIGPPGLPELGVEPGGEVVSINGIDAGKIVTALEPRMRGETAALRRLILERYFPEFLWVAIGGQSSYTLNVRIGPEIRPIEVAAGQAETDDAASYEYRFLGNGFGYMKVASFSIDKLGRFEPFLEQSFAAIARDGATTLIIDLRDNGGGAHDVSDLLMGYLTDRPYTAISAVKARVTEENIDRIPGVVLGDVVSLPFRQSVTPPADNPLRFNGRVVALIGPLTYSQAIVFTTTLQDHGIADIAGEPTEGPANQTGQVQTLDLTNTGFQAVAPIYIFTRASGDASVGGVEPEIPIRCDPLNPMACVSDLVAMLGESAPVEDGSSS